MISLYCMGKSSRLILLIIKKLQHVNYVGSDHNSKMIPAGNEEWINTFQVRRVAVPVNKELVLALDKL